MFYKSHRNVYGNYKGNVQNFKMTCVHSFTTKPSSSMTTYDIIEQY